MIEALEMFLVSKVLPATVIICFAIAAGMACWKAIMHVLRDLGL